MTIAYDHALHIGEQHLRQGKPCQDFALSGAVTDTTAFAIVSDGCSSGGQTDIGSRLVALATERALKECLARGEYSPEQINTERNLYIETYRRTLQLPLNDMLATSLWATMDASSLSVSVTGDGVFALLFEDLPPYIYEITWDKSAPYYPAYRLGGLDAGFKQHHDNITPLTITKQWQGVTDVNELYIEPGMNGLGFQFPTDSDLFQSPIIGVALFSDGVTQVDGLDTADATTSLVTYKSSTGQFFTRRMNRFLQDVKKNGRGLLDDIAGAVLYQQPEPSEGT
jgi:hypothetical protein